MNLEIPNSFIEIVRSARSVVVLTGAGVSKESGLDTFRDTGGVWHIYDPMMLASQRGFNSNPELVWKWYMDRRKNAWDAVPNPGHIALSKMESLFPIFTLFTQNVDRLHQRAGSKRVFELHGNIMESHCNGCGREYEKEINLSEGLPHCPVCKELVRPSVVWFGEQLPEDILEDAIMRSQSTDLFFTVGTSSEVYPAAQLPYLAKENGSYVVEINPNPTSFTPLADWSIMHPSGEAMPAILSSIEEIRK